MSDYPLHQVVAHARVNATSDRESAALLEALDAATLLLQRCILYTAHDNPALCRDIKAHIAEVTK